MAAPYQSGGDILIGQDVATGQIGQRTCNPQNAINATRRQPAIIDTLKGNGLNIGDHDFFFFSVTKLREKRDADKQA